MDIIVEELREADGSRLHLIRGIDQGAVMQLIDILERTPYTNFEVLCYVDAEIQGWKIEYGPVTSPEEFIVLLRNDGCKVAAQKLKAVLDAEDVT